LLVEMYYVDIGYFDNLVAILVTNYIAEYAFNSLSKYLLIVFVSAKDVAVEELLRRGFMANVCYIRERNDLISCLVLL